MKYLSFVILFVYSSQIFAGKLPSGEVGKLAALLSDQYAVLVQKSISESIEESGKVIYVTFSLEGFNQGNNFQQYLAVYKPELKRKAEPPFAEYGKPKYRLVGFKNICSSPLLVYKYGSLTLSEGEVSVVCAPLKYGRGQEQVLTYRIGQFEVY
ncbi:hypothetical protein TDB9533_04806 [Thalassocella blandensis]|nr:hypothetical protein TDB9533_04806 [Thalassocella blandensis]